MFVIGVTKSLAFSFRSQFGISSGPYALPGFSWSSLHTLKLQTAQGIQRHFAPGVLIGGAPQDDIPPEAVERRQAVMFRYTHMVMHTDSGFRVRPAQLFHLRPPSMPKSEHISRTNVIQPHSQGLFPSQGKVPGNEVGT